MTVGCLNVLLKPCTAGSDNAGPRVQLCVLQDVPGAVSVEEMTELLSLHKLCCGRSWHIQGCDARSGMGLHEGLDWLSRQLVAAGVLDVA